MPSHHPNHALRAGRKKQGLTQEELAEALGVSSKTVGRWERGLTRPSDYERRKLCQILQQSEEQLGLLSLQEEPGDIDTSSNDDAEQIVPVLAAKPLTNTHFSSDPSSENEASPYNENAPQLDPSRSPQEAHALSFFRSASDQAKTVAPALVRRRIVVRSGLAGLALASAGGLFYVVTGTGKVLAHKRIWPLATYSPNTALPIARVLQWMLKARSYNLGPTGVDGFFGKHTMSALHAFQQKSKLPIQDKVDASIWEKLIIPASVNTSGDHVFALQEQLNVRGAYPTVIPDGMFGPQTKNAVISFQKACQLPDTGQADLDTWCFLLGGHLA